MLDATSPTSQGITTEPRIYGAPEALNIEPAHVESVAQVSQDLKKLLEGAAAARLKTDVKVQVTRLNDWMNTYQKGLEAAQKISEVGHSALTEAQTELAAALDDYLRLEGEGGNPPTAEQEKLTADISKALRRISGLIPAIDQTFASGTGDTPEPEVEQPDEPEYDPQEPAGNPELPSEIPPVSNPEIKA